MKKTFPILMLIVALTTAACYYDKEEELYGTGCNVSSVSFATTVNPLLQQYGCLGCHNSITPSGNVNLQGHANVKAMATGGRLYGAISHSPGFVPMPLGRAKMYACDINKIKSWIDAGSPDN